MTVSEVREIVVVALLLLIICAMAFRRLQPVVPPTVSPQAMPVDEQVREVRHRVANVEQQAQSITDHAIRLRAVEREMGEVRGSLVEIKSGQARIERQLGMLLEHQLQHRDDHK